MYNVIFRLIVIIKPYLVWIGGEILKVSVEDDWHLVVRQFEEDRIDIGVPWAAWAEVGGHVVDSDSGVAGTQVHLAARHSIGSARLAAVGYADFIRSLEMKSKPYSSDVNLTVNKLW